jgi:hypothetical protein
MLFLMLLATTPYYYYHYQFTQRKSLTTVCRVMWVLFYDPSSIQRILPGFLLLILLRLIYFKQEAHWNWNHGGERILDDLACI